MRRNVLSVAGLAMLLAAGVTAALIGFAASPAQAGGSVCSDATHTCTWDGNGTDAASCQNISAGTGILWIFTGSATPTDLVVTWSNGETDTITGWVQQGDGSWHLQANLVGSFPPTSAYVDFTGTNGASGATLTISGCDEGGPPGTTTTVTTGTTTTSTTSTTTTGTTSTTPETTIHIVKTADAEQVDAGQSIGFTLTVYNTGGADALGVQLSDTLPVNAGLSWSIDAQGAGWAGTCAIDSGVLSCGGASGVTVPAGTLQGTSTFTVHITSSTTAATGGGCPGSGVVDNTANVTTSNAGSDQSSASTCVAGPAIEIVKTPDAAQVNAGDPIGFTLTVFNDGAGDATDVTLSDTLPTNAGLSWTVAAQGAGWGGTCAIATGVLTCGPVTVPHGTTQAASTFTVHITSPTTGATGGDCPGGSGVVNNTAEVTTSNAGSDQSPASTCVQAVVDLSVTKSGAPATQLLGQGNITWTMVVTNNGPSTATGVTIADPMPAGNTFVSASSTQGTCTGGGVLNCSIGTMAAGATVTITLVTTPSAAGTQSNTVTVTAQTPETNTSNNTATATVQVTAPLTPPAVFCVAVSKVSPKQLFVGRKTVLTIHVTRHGKAVQGIHVRIKGAKLDVRTKASNSKGVIKKTVKLKKAGVLVFSPIASKRCNTKRVGVTGVFTPPVTG